MKNPSEGAGQGPHITTPHSPASHVNSPCKCALLLHFCCFSHHRSRAACTKVTKCTECQQALSFGESDDFTLRCSQYGTRAHCAMPPPPLSLPTLTASLAVRVCVCGILALWFSPPWLPLPRSPTRTTMTPHHFPRLRCFLPLARSLLSFALSLLLLLPLR